MSKYTLAIAAISLLSAPLTYAEGTPKQTVEGAQLFLAKAAQQHGLGITHYREGVGYSNGITWRQRRVRRENEEMSKWIGAFPVKSANGSKCSTTFELDMTIAEDGARELKHNLNDRSDLEWFDVDEWTGTMLSVDWSRVTGVSRNEKVVSLVNVGQVTASTVELATRVQYAMEFLRNACDPTAGTGF